MIPRVANEDLVAVDRDAARLLPDHALRICGDGPIAGDLKRRAADLSNVSFLGHLSPERLATEIKQTAVITVPSRWYENFPYAVLEGMAAERAVVASAIGGLPEQFEHGVNGLLVPPSASVAMAEAVGGLLSNPDEAQRMGKAARVRIATRLDPEDHRRAVEAVYRELC